MCGHLWDILQLTGCLFEVIYSIPLTLHIIANIFIVLLLPCLFLYFSYYETSAEEFYSKELKFSTLKQSFAKCCQEGL